MGLGRHRIRVPQDRIGTDAPDARDAPAIQLNTLTVADDVAAFVRAIRRTSEIVSTEPLASATAVAIQPGA
jgi:choline dehydrogenase